jgi:hypothetical protein
MSQTEHFDALAEGYDALRVLLGPLNATCPTRSNTCWSG